MLLIEEYVKIFEEIYVTLESVKSMDVSVMPFVDMMLTTAI